MFIQHVKEVLQAAGIDGSGLQVADSMFGDYALPCFALAKELKRPPAVIASEIAQKIKPVGIIASVAVHGAYVNFTLDKTQVAAYVLSQIKKEGHKYGTGSAGVEKTVMIEFSSPNTNKPMHLGHVRNNALGRALTNLFAANGYKAIPANLVNDRGVHICKSMLAYQKWGGKATPISSGKKGDLFLGDWYLKFKQEAEKDPALEEEAQAMLQKWEAGDKKVIALWKKMRNWCLKGFATTYKQMGIHFDKYYYESEIWTGGRALAEAGLAKGVFSVTDDGAVKADLAEFNLPEKIIRRKDGTCLYVTQDMYLAAIRFKENALDKLVYVVGSEQDLHFQQLFAILKRMGYSWAEKCYHFSYGMVWLPGGVMKSRTGTVVDADDMMREMKGLACREVLKRYTDLPEKELKKRSSAIGLGALTFFMLKIDPRKDMTYDPMESIRFEGETGPYIQYAHARICSILAKHKKKLSAKPRTELLITEHEHVLVRLLSEYPAIVKSSCEQYDIHSICQYLIRLATAMNSFYVACPVLTAPDERLVEARLCLLDGVKQVMKNALAILGIEAPRRM